MRLHNRRTEPLDGKPGRRHLILFCLQPGSRALCEWQVRRDIGFVRSIIQRRSRAVQPGGTAGQRHFRLPYAVGSALVRRCRHCGYGIRGRSHRRDAGAPDGSGELLRGAAPPDDDTDDSRADGGFRDPCERFTRFARLPGPSTSKSNRSLRSQDDLHQIGFVPVEPVEPGWALRPGGRPR